MRLIKKLLTVYIALLLVVAVLPTAFAAEDDVIATGNGGEGITWTLTEGGLLTVSGNGPIVDEIEYEYDDDGEVISWQTLNSIAFTLSEYCDEQTKEMNVADSEHFRISLVREIVIEEGITAIPDGEMDGFYPRKVSLPSTLEELGYQAFNASFAEEVVIRSALPYAQFTVAGFRNDEEPYADIDSAIEGYVAKRVREEQFQKDSLPIFALQELFSLKNGLLEETEEDLAYMYEYYNEAFGSQATTPDELTNVALDLMNRHFGTSFTEMADIFNIEETEWGTDVVWNEELQTAYDTEANSVFEDGRMIQITLGDEFNEDEEAYGWLTVFGLAGSGAEKAAKTTGVNFVATTGTDNTFFGKIKSAFETVKAFFVRIINWIKLYLSILKK